MLKPIKSYFAPLTREQIEQNELTSKQAARIRREREEEKAEAARVVASQVNNVIEIIDDDSQEIGDNVRDSIEVIIHSLGPDVVTSTNVSRMPRPKKTHKRRPDNWIEIAQHWSVYKKVKSTMDKFDLKNRNPSYDYWQTMLPRWFKELNAGRTNPKIGRSPCVGDEVDKELVKIVEHYNSHGVPVTNLILKLAILDILKKKGRDDILNKIISDDADPEKGKIKLGKSWFQRFYRLVKNLISF
jgi:hypothetical protein